MVTRFRVGTNPPTQHLNLYVSNIYPFPKSYRDAFNDPNWQHAMSDEYHALIKNNTWTLMPRLTCQYYSFYVIEGVDVDETFSLVVKPGTIRTVLSLAISRHWPVHQLDVKNAFLPKDLFETVYMHQPPSYCDSVYPDYRNYATENLEQAHMISCNSCRTHDDIESKLGDVMQHVCLHMPDLREPHFLALKRVLRLVVPLLRDLPQDLVATGQVHVLHVPSRYQFADIFTKGFPSALLEEFHTSLSVQY
ncbi:ribonuclease H-like domain-containing protein [Tanacetum coccineum]|uniref:Ribonuclease H-like domain-containing protein n=1 Tax=Tanacetum coccineum TaxID=301880 RepID=A0ABQ5HW15_9ASTR